MPSMIATPARANLRLVIDVEVAGGRATTPDVSDDGFVRERRIVATRRRGSPSASCFEKRT